ncbi:MAG: SRPBCC family protein [Candidatus Hodarchaeales archaeon]|jgi:uncharacterized protein YndB with AHSA1/START domain
MVTLKDSIVIEAPPEEVYQWFLHIDENYLSWHPTHTNCYYLKGEPEEIGSIIVMEEILHGEKHKLKGKFVNFERNRRIDYTFSFPWSLIIPKGSFVFDATKKGCKFTATLSIRFGWFFSKIMPSRVKELVQHMNEEGKNLKELLSERNKSLV